MKEIPSTMPALELEPRHIRDFVVLDLDRTLLNTNVLVDIIVESLSYLGLNAEQIKQLQREEATARGHSFDVIGALHRISPDVSIAKLFEAVIQHPKRKTILVGGTEELLASLRDTTINHGILTFGINPEWQHLKVDILRFLCCLNNTDLLASVTDTTGKATHIENDWFDDERRQFLVPIELSGNPAGLWADTIHIVDDKISNLENSGSTNIYVYPVLPSDDVSLLYQSKQLLHRLTK